METQELVLLDRATVVATMEYLKQRPWAESNSLLTKLSQGKPATMTVAKTDEAADTEEEFIPDVVD